VVKAQANLGQMYARGEGVRRDNAEAYKWLRIATDQKEPTAANYLGDWMRLISPVEVAEGERRAREWRLKRMTAARPARG
jgi:hypothetical protein